MILRLFYCVLLSVARAGNQADSVSVGDKVQIVNARMRAFRGEKQLQVGRNGAVKVE
jgi:ssDNA-binding replication factor A large subunit